MRASMEAMTPMKARMTRGKLQTRAATVLLIEAIRATEKVKVSWAAKMPRTFLMNPNLVLI